MMQKCCGYVAICSLKLIGCKPLRMSATSLLCDLEALPALLCELCTYTLNDLIPNYLSLYIRNWDIFLNPITTAKLMDSQLVTNNFFSIK